jgi:hypothetical protein
LSIASKFNQPSFPRGLLNIQAFSSHALVSYNIPFSEHLECISALSVVQKVRLLVYGLQEEGPHLHFHVPAPVLSSPLPRAN